MLHPNQFQVNEAWIAFRLNDAPIRTEADGDFNIVVLMDAASCFLLTSEFISTDVSEPSRIDAARLLKNGYAHKQEFPKTLFIPSELPANHLALEAQRQKVGIIRVPEVQLMVFIGEAKEAFREHVDRGNMK
jgi:hypothetical protein